MCSEDVPLVKQLEKERRDRTFVSYLAEVA
jgi:hypothetical protein